MCWLITSEHRWLIAVCSRDSRSGRPNLADDGQYQARFRREAQSAAVLDEPHIVPIHDFGEIDSRLYVTMRLIDGKTVDELLVNGPLPPQRESGFSAVSGNDRGGAHGK